MKKILLLILLVISSLSGIINAQSNYVTFGLGSPPVYFAPSYQIEVGHKFKWVDLSVIMINQTDLPGTYLQGDISTENAELQSVISDGNDMSNTQRSALLLNVKFNLFQFIKNNYRHRLLAGIGLGFGEETKIYANLKNPAYRDLSVFYYSTFLNPSFQVQYEYMINKGIGLGAKFDYVSGVEIASISFTLSRKF